MAQTLVVDAPTPAPSQGPGPAGDRPLLPRPKPRNILVAIVLLALAAASVWAFGGLGISITFIAKSLDNAQRFFARVVPLEFPPAGELVHSGLVTLSIVICGTVLGALISTPIAFLAARNTSPNGVARGIARGITVLARAVPELVLAIILATMFSLGALPGILAIGLHSVGMIGKLYADAIEQIDEGPRTAIRATGGSKFQEYVVGVLPQVAPSWIATTLHRNDINLRGSVILGFVGVAGLGEDLALALGRLDYQEALAIALVLFVLCVLMEVISSTVRTMILGREPTGRGLGDRTVRAARRRLGKAPVADAALSGTGAGTSRAGAAVAAEPRLSAPWTARRIQVNLFGWGAVAIIIGSMAFADITWGDFLTFWKFLPERVGALFPLSFGTTSASDVFGKVGETVMIALAATLVAVILSTIVGSFAARNVAPNAGARAIARLLLVGIRGIPELILAIVFILITGLGAPAAALALGIGGVGLLGKLLADSIEEVNAGPERALRATGASRGQVYAASTFPQAAPAFVGHIFYLLDNNVRASTMLGIVGGGGVGFMLITSARLSQYNVVLTVTLLILAVVLVIEGLSMWIRKSLSPERSH